MTSGRLKTLQSIATTVSAFPPTFPIHIRNKIIVNTHQADEILQFAMKNSQYLPPHMNSRPLYKHPFPSPLLPNSWSAIHPYPFAPHHKEMNQSTMNLKSYNLVLSHFNARPHSLQQFPHYDQAADPIETMMKLHHSNEHITHLATRVFTTLQLSITTCPNKDTNLQKLFRPSDFLSRG